MPEKIKKWSVLGCAAILLLCFVFVFSFHNSAQKTKNVFFAEGDPVSEWSTSLPTEPSTAEDATTANGGEAKKEPQKKKTKKTKKNEKQTTETPTQPTSGENEPTTLISDNGSAAGKADEPTIGTAPVPTGGFAVLQIDEQPQSSSSINKDAVGKVCMVSGVYASTRPVSPLSNTYVPTYNTLPSGTLDTVTGITSCDDNGEKNDYYILQSGCVVNAEDCVVLDGCTLTDNSLSLLSCAQDANGTTLTLSSAWRVPFRVNVTPQEYGKDHGISSFTADKLEIEFFYTPTCSGRVDVSQSPVLGSYSFYSDSVQKKTCLTLNFRYTGRFYGYEIGYDANGCLFITVSDRVKSLENAAVILDPGHGGSDSGATANGGQVREDKINALLASLVAERLVRMGATVYMTGNGESDVSLEQRKAQALSLKPDVFVSIHCNSSTNEASHGATSFYFHPWSKSLAGCIQSRLVSVYDAVLSPGRDNDLGTRYFPYSVCRTTVCPSVLIETGFLSNEDDRFALTDFVSEGRIADAIAGGIADYLASQN